MKDRNKTVRLVYGSILGVMTVILGALFIWQVLDIYFTGTAADYTGKYIFSRENTGEHLMRILPAFVVWLVMCAAGFVLWEIFPSSEPRVKTDVRYSLWRLKKRMPSEAGGDLQESYKAVKREESILEYLWVACFAVVFLAAVYVVVYLMVPSNFPSTENKTEVILEMVKNIMPCVAAAFAVCIAAAIYEGKSARKQLEHVKKLTKGFKPVEAAPGKVSAVIHHKYFLLGVRIGVGCLGVALVIAGIFNGSIHDLLVKAINICTECIGLG